MNTIVSQIDNGIAPGHAWDKHICLVKISEAKDTENSKDIRGQEVDTCRLWPALVFDSFNTLRLQLPSNDEIRAYIETRIRQLRPTMTRDHGVAYLIGKGTLMPVPRNKYGGVMYIKDDENNYEKDTVFDFSEHIDEMEAAKGYCASEHFQDAYKLTLDRYNESGYKKVGNKDSGKETMLPTTNTSRENTTPLSSQSASRNETSSMSYLGMLVDYVYQRTTPAQAEEPKQNESGHPCPNLSSQSQCKTNNTFTSENVERSMYAKEATLVTPSEGGPVGGKKSKDGKARKARNRKRKKKNQSSAYKKVVGGYRMIPTSDLLFTPKSLDSKAVKRDCLPRAILSLLTGRCTKNRVLESIEKIMPNNGSDTSIEIANMGLSEHGLKLKSVSRDYMNRSLGVCFNLLQLHTCKLVIKICLTSHRKNEEIAHHFVGWDGTTIYDYPQSVKVIRKDRLDKNSCLKVFQGLYPANDYAKFWITNVYELCSMKDKSS